MFEVGETPFPRQEPEEVEEIIIMPDNRGTIPPGSPSISTPKEQVQTRAQLIDACFSDTSWLGSEVAPADGQPGQVGAGSRVDEGLLVPLGMLVGAWFWVAERVPPASGARNHRHRPGSREAR